LASGSFDGRINVWNTATRTLQGTLEGSGSGFEWLKWHPRGHLIIAGSEDCNLWMWNADHNAILNTFAGHSSTVTCGDFTPDGKLICTGSDDASLRIWDPRTAQSRHVVRGHGYHTDGLTCLSVTSDSQTIVSGSKDNSVCVVNINSGQVSVLMTQASVSLSCKLVHRLEFFLVLFENVCSLAFWYHHHRCRFAGCWLTGRPHWLY
jgi:WD40 repeat protein